MANDIPDTVEIEQVYEEGTERKSRPINPRTYDNVKLDSVEVQKITGPIEFATGPIEFATRPTVGGGDVALKSELDTETASRTEVDESLGSRIDAEAKARSVGDIALGERIDTETNERKNGDDELNKRLEYLSESKQDKENMVTDISQQVEDNKYPSANAVKSATADMQLKTNMVSDFTDPELGLKYPSAKLVKDAIQTATANFLGSWNTWEAVPEVASGFRITPTKNDYIVVTFDTSHGHAGQTWRYKYLLDTTKNEYDKNDWIPEYVISTVSMEMLYPVGSIYLNGSNSSNPGTFLGFGNWTRIGQGRCLVGVDEDNTKFNAAGMTGGRETVTLSVDQMPNHRHGTQSHNHTIGNHNHYISEGAINGYANDVAILTTSPDRGGMLNYDDIKTFAYGGDSSQRRYGKLILNNDNKIYTSSGGGNSGDSTVMVNYAGGENPHENLQPYVTVYMWMRVS